MPSSMTDLAKLYYSFWNGIIKAYVEYAVPDDAVLPYITYTLGRTDYLTDGLQQVRIWTRSKSFAPLMGYCDQVEELIPQCGLSITLPDNKGGIFISRGTPFIQHMPMDDKDLKVAYINVIVRSYIL